VSPHFDQWALFSQALSPLAQTSNYATYGCHCMFKTFHGSFCGHLSIWFQASSKKWRLEINNFVHYVTFTLVNDSFFLLKLFRFDSTNTSVCSFIFPRKRQFYIYIYIKGPFLSFSQGPHTTLIRPFP